MRPLPIALAVSLVLPLGWTGATPEDEQFERIATGYIEQELAAYPEQATELGDHRFDDRLTDYSSDKRAGLLAAHCS